MTALRSTIIGVGSCLPKKAVTNAELAQRVDTNDAWIVQRTGIKQRYIADDTETTASLACGGKKSACPRED